MCTPVHSVWKYFQHLHVWLVYTTSELLTVIKTMGKTENREPLWSPSSTHIKYIHWFFSTSLLLLVLATVLVTVQIQKLWTNQSLTPVLLFVCWTLYDPIVHCDLGAILELLPIQNKLCFETLALCISHRHFNNNLHVYSSLGTIFTALPQPCLYLEAFASSFPGNYSTV